MKMKRTTLAGLLLALAALGSAAAIPAQAGMTNAYNAQISTYCGDSAWQWLTVHTSWAPLAWEYQQVSMVQIETVTSETFVVPAAFAEAAMVNRMGMVSHNQWVGYYPEEGGWHVTAGPLNSQGGMLQPWSVEAHWRIGIGTHLTISGVPGAYIVDGVADVPRNTIVVYIGTGAQAQRWAHAISPDTNDRFMVCFFTPGRY